MVQEPAPADELTRSLEQGGGNLGVSPEDGELLIGEGTLARRARQVRPQHVRVVRVDHRRLGGAVEQVGGVLDQVLVERIVLGHQHGQGGLASPARPPRLLPE